MYKKYWDTYYVNNFRKSDKGALWDVSPDEAAGRDGQLFQDYFLRSLPIIDLGCGSGTQSAFFAERYDKVLGVDVSEEAVKLATEMWDYPNLNFDTLDVTDHKKAQKIHEKLGDVNVYMRGVLHQILEEDLDSFQKTIQSLLGEKGSMFCIEVSQKIHDHFSQVKGGFSQLPAKMRQVFIANLPPKGLSVERIQNYFPKNEFEIQNLGDTFLATNLKLKDGTSIQIPAVYALIKNK